MNLHWYYHPESDSVFPSEPPAETEQGSIEVMQLVELGPVVAGTMVEILALLHQHNITPSKVTIDRRLWSQ